MFHCTDPSTPEIYTLSLHDALPIYREAQVHGDLHRHGEAVAADVRRRQRPRRDRKSTRLNSSHPSISYAVFCLKKNKTVLNIIEMIHPGKAEPQHAVARLTKSLITA